MRQHRLLHLLGHELSARWFRLRVSIHSLFFSPLSSLIRSSTSAKEEDCVTFAPEGPEWPSLRRLAVGSACAFALTGEVEPMLATALC